MTRKRLLTLIALGAAAAVLLRAARYADGEASPYTWSVAP